ncbi:MAG: tetratricopeptide repeat protein [Phycisphaerae bacterium]|nr:tetratricopeptide repeat protein [Phycisphaerae bacterium]
MSQERSPVSHAAEAGNVTGTALPRRPWRSIATGATRRRIFSTAAILSILLLSGCAVVRKHQAKRHVARGDELLQADHLDEALAEFEAAAEVAPQLAVVHSRLGNLYERMGDYTRAIDAFVEAVRRDPRSFDDTFSLARLYQLTNQLVDAIRAYLHAVELRPNDAQTQLNLGTCYHQSGDYAQAVVRFEKAIELDPSTPEAFVNLGVSLDAQGKHYEAVRAYREALERDSQQPMVLVNLAKTYMKQDRLKLARQALEQAVRMDDRLAEAHEALGYCLFRMREMDAAAESYRRALACDWRLPRAHAGLGSIKMLAYLSQPDRNDLREEALEHWHRSLELAPDQPKIRSLIERYRVSRSDPSAALLDGG